MASLRYFTVLCLLIYSKAKNLHYDYEFDKEAKVWVKLHRIGATWHEARKMCNMEGAVLASPLNKPIKTALETHSKAYDIDQIFVGIHSTFSGNFWYSIEGVSLETMIDILDKSKLSHDDKRCTVLSAGFLTSVSCSEVYPYICYKQDNADVQLTSCGTIDKEYVLYQETGNCYKFHTHEQTWWNAFKTCSAEQAYLTIINSEIEGQVIKDIFEKHPSDTIVPHHGNVISLGIIDWEQNGEWYTIHGERLESVYYNWSGREPNNAHGDEYCVTMYRNGLYNDDSCSKKTAFICEKDVRNVDSTENTTEAEYWRNEDSTESVTRAENWRNEDSTQSITRAKNWRNGDSTESITRAENWRNDDSTEGSTRSKNWRNEDSNESITRADHWRNEDSTESITKAGYWRNGDNTFSTTGAQYSVSTDEITKM